LTQPHPASQQPAACFDFPSGIEVLGQVVGVAMILDPQWRRHART
jgi:hypothetical protein